MKAAVIAGPRGIEIEDRPPPEPGAGQVRLQIGGCGVCGSNLLAWQGRPWFRYPLAPGAPGHEAWGTVDAAGPGVRGLDVVNAHERDPGVYVEGMRGAIAAIQLARSWRLPAGRDSVIEAAFYGTKGGVSLRNVGGSFYDFVVERYRGTARETLVAPPDDLEALRAALLEAIRSPERRGEARGGLPMRVVIFCHSLVSDWNHGNAHFLRGVATDLVARGHDVVAYEPFDAWSAQNLVADAGEEALSRYRSAYPHLDPVRYRLEDLDLERALEGADLVLVHEWNDHDLVRRIGEHRVRSSRPYVLLFHDTHHRAVTDPAAMSAYRLDGYDGVLAFGEVIRQIYVSRGWSSRAFTWHEAADTRVFKPLASVEREGDLVWIGNWGDEERTAELHEFVIDPARALALRARVHGVRYPEAARAALASAGIAYAGWLPNHEVPRVFAAFRVTVHVPRRPYVASLPGIPTIRPFEALACGIPLVCAPWDDAERLFTPGADYLVARDGPEMRAHLRALLSDAPMAAAMAAHGRATILARHTCGHRVDELLRFAAAIAARPTKPAEAARG